MRWMNPIFLICTLFIVNPITAKKLATLPRNISQAIHILNKVCPDSIKSIIKNANDDDLSDLFYPGKYKFRVVYDWTSEDNELLGVNRYLFKRGIDRLYADNVIYESFKAFLNGEKKFERRILQKYQTMLWNIRYNDSIRYTADSLFNKYIPSNLNECFYELNSILDDTIKLSIMNQNVDSFIFNSYFGLGQFLRNRWQLWGGSRLSKYMESIGVCQAEGMSSYILRQYYNYLNNKEISFPKDDTFCIQYFRTMAEDNKIRREERLKRYMNKLKQFNIGDTVHFNFDYGYSDNEQKILALSDKCKAIGIIVDKSDSIRGIKVKIIETCNRKGLLVYDNKNIISFNPRIGVYEHPSKRIRTYAKKNKVEWYSVDLWDKVGFDGYPESEEQED